MGAVSFVRRFNQYLVLSVGLRTGIGYFEKGVQSRNGREVLSRTWHSGFRKIITDKRAS